VTTNPTRVAFLDGVRTALSKDSQDRWKFRPFYEWFASHFGVPRTDVRAGIINESRQTSSRIRREMGGADPVYAVAVYDPSGESLANVLRWTDVAIDEGRLSRLKVLIVFRELTPEHIVVFDSGDPVVIELLALFPEVTPEVRSSPVPPTIPGLGFVDLVSAFRGLLEDVGAVFDKLDQLDLLACVLGSQLVLFAGPSGTGKSTAASLLARFFSRRHARLEIGRGMQRPEELVGYYSTIGDVFIETTHLERLLPIDATAGGTDVPFCVVEEANISPVEGYFAPIFHDLSAVVVERATIPLHRYPDAATALGAEVPFDLVLGPFPRFLATVNVDPTAPAPAKKVAGRACVVLLEPQDLDSTLTAIDALAEVPTSSNDARGAGTIGDPRNAFAMVRLVRAWPSFRESVRAMADLLRKSVGADLVTPRDVNRAVLYMAYFVGLAMADGWSFDDAVTMAGENAVLHFVLPGLAGSHFEKALDALQKATLHAQGLLRKRVDRLAAIAEMSGFGPPPDFWSALS
jgi:hypothetical protein